MALHHPMQVMILVFVLAGTAYSQSLSIGSWGRSRIHLDNNGYSGILAAIDPRIPFNESLLHTFKSILTSASSFLFNATNHRAFFRDVSVLIPQHWPEIPGQRFAPQVAQLSAANIIVRSPGNYADIPPQPFVRQPGQCGNPGEYMHLTPEFIMSGDTRTWGDPAKVIVHEWGHLRWGLYDEYPSPSTDPQFYISSGGRLEGTKCSAAITGVAVPPVASSLTRADPLQQQSQEVSCNVNEGEIPPPQCRFRPNNIAQQTASGSIMYSVHIPSINSFCQSDTTSNPAALHSPEAPTEQNRLCKGQSSWDVMLKSPDFLNNSNAPRDLVDTTPTFTLIRQRERTVLIIDRTNDMNDDESWQHVVSMCKRFIRESPANSQVGIVSYSLFKPVIRARLTDMNTQGKQSLLSIIGNLESPESTRQLNPAQTLRQAYTKVLLNNTGIANKGVGASIVLFSGWQGSAVSITQQVGSLRAQGVIVRAVEYGPPDIPRQNINIPGVLEPSPLFAYRLPPPGNPELVEPQHEPIFHDLENDRTLVQVIRKSVDLMPHQNVSYPVFMDGTIGRSTTFRFAWDHNPLPVMEVRNPSGHVYNMRSPPVAVLDVGSQKLDFRLPGLVQKGTWHVNIHNRESADQTVDVQVFSGASQPLQQAPIRARPILMQREIGIRAAQKLILYGEVKQGEMPVVGATVTMTVERPNGNDVDIILRDSGIGADTRRNDGVYSAYFMQFTEEGNYQMEMRVRGDSTATKQTSPWSASGVMPANWDLVEQPIEIVSVDPFMRAPPEITLEVSGNVASLMSRDQFPPARINDLEVLGFDEVAMTVRIRWTAMGDDYEAGQASHYEIRYSNDANTFARLFSSGVLVNQGLVLDGNLMAPKPSFKTEIMTIRLQPSYCNPVCAIRLLARDEVRNEGEPSNMVTVVTPSIPTTSGTFTSLFGVTSMSGGRQPGGGGGRPRTTGAWGFSPGFIPGFVTSTPGVGIAGMTTAPRQKGDSPKGSITRKRHTATIIAVAVVAILLFITMVVVYTVWRHTSCNAGMVKRFRHRNQQWAGPHDTTSETNLDMPPKKPRKPRRTVCDALVLEDM